MFDRRITKIEDLCLALAQLADELEVETNDSTGKCRVVFTVDSGHLDAALERVRS